LAEILRQVDRISEARRERRVMADGIVPAIIWVVLFGGAFLTIGFTFFFGAENLRASIADDRRFVDPNLCRVADVVEIDHPFAGTVKVGPETLAAWLRISPELRHSDSQCPLFILGLSGDVRLEAPK